MTHVSSSSPLPERRYDVVLPGAESARRFWGMLVFALLWNLICGLGGGSLVLAAGEHMPLFPKIIVALFIAIGLGMIAYVVKEYLARRKLHPPVIRLSAQPLCVGETVHGRFLQHAKSPAEIEHVRLRLICRERSTYGSGTDQTTVTHDVFTAEHTASENTAANSVQPIEFEFDFEIPPDAMHSFTARWNSVDWFLESQTSVANWPDYSNACKIEVVPIRFRQDEPAGEKSS